MGNAIGYGRTSTTAQDGAAERAALEAAGALRVFFDQGQSSRIADRSEWRACVEYLRPGDTLLVWRLDRLAGSERMLIELIHDLERRSVDLRSLTEPEIDTTTPMGRALFGIVAVFAQLRIDTIRENTMRGLEHARRQGRIGGRPTVMTPERIEAAREMHAAGQSFTRIARVLGVGATTVRRALEAHRVP